MNSSHTPTPWMTKEGQIYGQDGKTLALIPYYDKEIKRDVANAELIVKCVNSHNGLVEALKAIKNDIPTLWGDNINGGKGTFILSGNTLDLVEQALYKENYQ